MGAFSQSMRQVAQKLTRELGNSCILSKITPGTYDPSTGKTGEVRIDVPTFSAQSSKSNEIFGLTGENTNLNAFDTESLVLPWIGQEIDATWLYNGHNIVAVTPVMSQNDIIIYMIRVGEKR